LIKNRYLFEGTTTKENEADQEQIREA